MALLCDDVMATGEDSFSNGITCGNQTLDNTSDGGEDGGDEEEDEDDEDGRGALVNISVCLLYLFYFDSS
jgi:hypothetical protein